MLPHYSIHFLCDPLQYPSFTAIFLPTAVHSRSVYCLLESDSNRNSHHFLQHYSCRKGHISFCIHTPELTLSFPWDAGFPLPHTVTCGKTHTQSDWYLYSYRSLDYCVVVEKFFQELWITFGLISRYFDRKLVASVLWSVNKNKSLFFLSERNQIWEPVVGATCLWFEDQSYGLFIAVLPITLRLMEADAVNLHMLQPM